MALVVGLVAPGWCLLTLLGTRDVPFSLALPASIGLSLAIVSIAAWLGWATHTGLWGTVALAAVATAAVIALRFGLHARAAPPVRPDRSDLGAGLLALGSLVLAWANGPWLSQTADTFYHLAAARSLLRTQAALPQDIFFGVPVTYPDDTSGSLHVVLAWTSALTGLFPAWTALTVFGAAFTVLAFAALAREVTQSTAASIAATLLFIVLWLDLDMRTSAYPNRFAPGLVWLCLVFLVRFSRRPDRGSWPDVAVAALLGVAAGTVHSGMSPFLVVIVPTAFGTAAVVALWRRNLRPLWPLAIACAVILGATLPILLLRILAIPTPGPDGWLFTEAPPIKTHVIAGYPFVDFRFWFDGVLALTVIGTLSLVGRARTAWLQGDLGGALLVGGILVVPAVSITPILTFSATGLYYFARIADLLLPLLFIPLGWELAWAVPKLITMGRRPVPGRDLYGPLLAAAGVAVLLVEYVPAGAYTRYFGHDQLTVAASRHNDLTVQWADRLHALDAAGDGTLLADLDASYEIAGLTGRRIVAVSFSHIPYQDQARDGMLRLGDVLDALRPAQDSTDLMSILVRYHVRFVMVDREMDGEATFEWLTARPALVQVAGGGEWALLRFDPTRLDQELQLPYPDPAIASPARVIAGRAVFVRFVAAGSSYQITATAQTNGKIYRSSGTVPASSIATLKPPTVTAPLLFPDDAPVDTYHVSVSLAGGPPEDAGEVQVGRDYEAESFGGIIDFFYNGGFIRNPGWLTTYGPFSRGVAATGLRPGAVASRPLLNPPGDYCLDVRVLDQGDGKQRAIEVGLGGTTLNLTWSGQKAGLRDLVQPVHVGSANRLISFEVVAGSTVPLTVDRLTLYPPVSGAC